MLKDGKTDLAFGERNAQGQIDEPIFPINGDYVQELRQMAEQIFVSDFAEDERLAQTAMGIATSMEAAQKRRDEEGFEGVKKLLGE